MTIERVIDNTKPEEEFSIADRSCGESIIPPPTPLPILLKISSQSPEQLIRLLIKSHGDIWKLCSRFEGEPAHNIFAIEAKMDEAIPEFKAQWNKLLEIFQSSRMRLVQRRAIDYLENQHPGEDNKAFKDYLAFSKLALNDLFVSQAQIAKKKVDNRESGDLTLDKIAQDFDTDASSS